MGALAIGQLGIITALAFYFGWTHTQAYLRYFGLDTSLVQYTTTDYVLRSVGASYWPLMGLGLLTVVALAVHTSLSSRIRNKEHAGQRRYRLLIGAAGAAMIALAALGLGQILHFPPSIPVIPLSITVGVGLLAYAWVLESVLDQEVKMRREVQLVALVSIVIGGVFWAWGSYAATAGTRLAEEVKEDLPYRPDVSVYSVSRLALEGHGVEVQPLDGPDSRYRFRYTGLRLLTRSEERYFLLPRGWERGQDAVVILTESESVRLEFWAPPYQ